MATKRCADVLVSPRVRMAKRIVIESPLPRLCLPYLSSDLVLSILSWLPSKSVVRFKSVCKAWQAMISDPDFIYAHLECSKKRRPSLLMVPCAYHPTDHQKNEDDTVFRLGFYKYHRDDAEELIHLEELPQGIALWSRPLHCNGLILISTTRQELMICNPATREFVTLPKNRKRRECEYTPPRAGIGFDPCSKKYKVARVYYQRIKRRYDVVCKFEVLTLGSNMWRQTIDPPYWIKGQTPVHVNGNIYWTCCGKKLAPEDPPDSFLRFSLTDEKFSLVPFPPSDFKPTRFVESESQLCCVCFCSRKQGLEVWTLNVTLDQNPVWNRCWSTRVSSDLIAELPRCLALRPAKVAIHEETWLLTHERNIYQYDTKTSEIHKTYSGVPDTRL